MSRPSHVHQLLSTVQLASASCYLSNSESSINQETIDHKEFRQNGQRTESKLADIFSLNVIQLQPKHKIKFVFCTVMCEACPTHCFGCVLLTCITKLRAVGDGSLDIMILHAEECTACIFVIAFAYIMKSKRSDRVRKAQLLKEYIESFLSTCVVFIMLILCMLTSNGFYLSLIF